VRDELRSAAASGILAEETVKLLTDGLSDLRRRLVQQLRG
jgi:hypothetical protein